MQQPISLVEASPDCRDAMADLFRTVCRQGDALPFTPDIPDAAFDAMWLSAGVQTYVALVDGSLAGMYKLNANLPGRAAHVGSATYLVRPDLQGQGIGTAMLRDSLARAAAQGYRSMQFNFVVSTNRAAVSLYERHGFRIVGTLPEAFLHARSGFVDAYVMSRPIAPAMQ
ncbi:GNAT family N-acetyltransferase [Pseudoduganella plicata]|uniref:GNAT family N-acetyltransferase n=1 Tax=Pseudoduganella plicata TaxID=321984 RepID=UPI00141BD98F|nr:N-acetyltransferase [Pseudoduganella plicata]